MLLQDDIIKRVGEVGNYNNLTSKQILKKVESSKNTSVATGVSASLATVLIPIIITLINKLENSDSDLFIISLSVVCCVAIIATVFGVVTMSKDKGAVNALKKDLEDMEGVINDCFEMEDENVKVKSQADCEQSCAKIPKKILKNKKK